MSNQTALHNRPHTFAKVYRLAMDNAKSFKDDPENKVSKSQAEYYKALAMYWARSDREYAIANAIEINS